MPIPQPQDFGLKDKANINENTHPVTEIEFRLIMATPEYRDAMRVLIVDGVRRLRIAQYNRAVNDFVTGR
jgi:hypothetical protein